MLSGSNSHPVNSPSSKRKGSEEGEASQSSGSSRKKEFCPELDKRFPLVGIIMMARICDANFHAAGLQRVTHHLCL